MYSKYLYMHMHIFTHSHLKTKLMIDRNFIHSEYQIETDALDVDLWESLSMNFSKY